MTGAIEAGIPALRQQPPVASPLSWTGLGAAVRAATRLTHDPRPWLAAHLKRQFHATHATLTASGTVALTLALQRAARETGDGPVALPAYACPDLATATVAAGVTAVLYDTDPDTLSPDMASLERLTAHGVRVVVIAPLFGIPVRWDEIQALAHARGLVIIEDAAQAFGASWGGTPCGALGALSVLSFGRGKGWTGGAGGVLLERGAAGVAPPPPAPWAEEWRVLVAAAAQHVWARPGVYRIPAWLPWLHLGESRYREPEPARSATWAMAALLRHTWGLSRREVVRRRVNAQALLDDVRPLGLRAIVPAAPAVPGWLRLPLRVPGGWSRITHAGAARRWGAMRGYPGTLAAWTVMANRLAWRTRCPGAEQLVRELITLPTHSGVTAADRRRLVRALGSAPAPGDR